MICLGVVPMLDSAQAPTPVPSGSTPAQNPANSAANANPQQTGSAASDANSAQTANSSFTGSVLKSTTRLVQLNVIVEDQHGRPVLNLKKEDFTLTDEGTEQEVAIFSPAVLVQEHARDTAKASNVYDNRDPEEGKSGSVSVILIDALNTTFEDQVRVKAQVLKLLRQHNPKEYLAIYLLREKLYVLQDFTQDAKALLAAVDRVKPNALGPLDASIVASAEMGLEGFGDREFRALGAHHREEAQVAFAALDQRVKLTIGAFTGIAYHMAYISGRKSLIWISSSFPILFGYGGTTLTPNSMVDPQNYSAELETAARALNRVNMSVYPVDAGGVQMGGGAGGAAPDASLSSAFFGRAGGRDTMNMIARQTGGRAFYGTNDLTEAMSKAIGETELSYLVGFYPNHNRWDGSYHRLKLRSKSSGLRVRYRDGYFATTELPDEHGEMKTDLARATKNPVDSTSLRLRVTAKKLDAVTGGALRFYVHLDVQELFLEKGANETRDGGVDLLFYQMSEGETPVAARRQHMDLHLGAQEYAELVKKGILLGSRQQIAADARTLRIFARDSSGAMGSVTIPLAAVMKDVAP
jgi:VWFA-related protein